MIDREKIIKGIEACLPPHDPNCNLCPYYNIDLRCKVDLRNDIALLIMQNSAQCFNTKVKITNEQAIEQLQKTGWLQAHDKEIASGNLTNLINEVMKDKNKSISINIFPVEDEK